LEADAKTLASDWEAWGLEGADYVAILAHYYGGLTPEDAGAHLPDEVVVGRPRLGPWLGDVHRIRPSAVVDETDAAGPRSGGDQVGDRER
jgi:hypothetical protein